MVWPFGNKKRIPRRRVKARRYEAAKIGRLVDGWTTRPVVIDEDVQRDGRTLIARARHLAQNNDYASRFLGLAGANVVGARGVRLQSQVPLGRVGTGGRDTGASEAIERGWRTWSLSADITERLRWIDVQRLYLLSLLRDGEAILRHRVGRTSYGYAVQLLDPIALDHRLNKRLSNGNEIVMGVELDLDRRPVNYWFSKDERSPADAAISDGREYVVIPASEIIHSFLCDRVNQTRGVTCFAPTMLRAHNLEGFEESVIVAARMAASTMGFFSDNEAGEGYTGDGENAEGQLEVELEPGTFMKLPHGVGLETFRAEQPQGVFADFVRQTLRGMAAGLNVSYHALANDLGDVNYSSARIGLLEDREFWRGMQSFVIDHLCRPVFTRWLDAQLARDTLTVGGRPLRLADRARYLEANFVGRRWSWVDPLKESQAAALEVKLRTRSVSDIIRERGDSPDEVWAEIADERAKLAELGIAFSDDGVTSTPTQEPGP